VKTFLTAFISAADNFYDQTASVLITTLFEISTLKYRS